MFKGPQSTVSQMSSNVRKGGSIKCEGVRPDIYYCFILELFWSYYYFNGYFSLKSQKKIQSLLPLWIGNYVRLGKKKPMKEKINLPTKKKVVVMGGGGELVAY